MTFGAGAAWENPNIPRARGLRVAGAETAVLPWHATQLSLIAMKTARRLPRAVQPCAVAAAPAAAGFAPRTIALAVAAVFGWGAALAQPQGAQAIHGAATLSPQGRHLVVTTQNGAGTNAS